MKYCHALFSTRLIIFLLAFELCLLTSRIEAVADEPPGEQKTSSEQWVNLLEELDLVRQRVAGEWKLENEELSVSAANGSRIMLPWKAVGEYEFEVQFTRNSGSNSIALIFVAGGNQASFDIDGWGQHLAGFQNINGQTMRDNPTRVAELQLQNGQKQTALIRVRKDRIEAFLNGKQIVSHQTDGSDLSLIKLWQIPDKKSLGLGAWNSATTFHQVRFRPLSKSLAVPMLHAAPRKITPAGKTVTTADFNRAGKVSFSSLNDEFDDIDSLKNWKRVYQVEQSGADQLERIDINQSRPGWLTLVPRTSTWYMEYRGVLLFKEIEGDFVVSTKASVSNRAGRGAPRSNYSLGGLMVRKPRNITAGTWKPGGENYIFLSLGAGTIPGRFAFEVKTTRSSKSQLKVELIPSGEAEIRVARIGEYFVLLRRLNGGQWSIHRRYHRRDMPARVQVGFTVYTDFATASRMQPREQNRTVIKGGNPDLIASFDYYRISKPNVPANLQGRRFSDPNSVSDADLLRFLGGSVDK